MNQFFKSLLCILFILGLQHKIIAQSAYHGGKGSGYNSASTSFQIGTRGNLDSSANTYRLYPSPVPMGQNLWLEFQNNSNSLVTVQMADVLGQVFSVFNTYENKLNINTTSLAQGMYFLRIGINDKFFTAKFLIIGNH